MLDVLSEGFKKASQSLQGKATLTSENVKEAVSKIRKSLLEADVEYSVAKTFIERVKERALGQDVKLRAGKSRQKVKVTTGDHFIRVCQESLEELMGPADSSLSLPKDRPARIMMVGLQGTGKTTTTGKLANYLQTKGYKPLLVAADTYRPAAVDQLKVLARRVNCPVFHINGESPVEICKQANKKASELACDVILYDTAGRLTIDSELMAELKEIKSQCTPDNTILVCDAMMGQDAVVTAKSFHSDLSLTGVVMTKLDGDARGGAALSIREVTGVPIKFLGMGEDLERLEEFRPEGLASRILGQGDVVGLMEDFERVSSEEQEADALRILAGGFTLKDFTEQISMIQKMGPVKDILAKMPQGLFPKGADLNIDESEFVRINAIIGSMTAAERLNPEIIDLSRKKRISLGSGNKLSDVENLLSRFKMMRKIFGKIGGSMTRQGLLSKVPGMKAFGQINQLMKAARKSASQQMAPDFDSIMGSQRPAAPMKRVDRDKLRKARRNAKASRKKNRKK